MHSSLNPSEKHKHTHRHELTGRSICVQVPVLFTGTMRSNLDPFERHSDMDIWAALRRAHLARVVESNPLGLEMNLAEGGAPLSAGQKQLVALARALLRNSKVKISTSEHASTIAERVCTICHEYSMLKPIG